jgi:endonuclease YncB( thermonuclease family)
VPGRPADAEQLTVRYVYDGDTLQAQPRRRGRYVTTTGKIRIRLIGIDAPEMRPEAECFGPEATRRLEVLAPRGSQVWVAPDRDSWDRYGRRLFMVWTADGRLLNYDLVADGSAEAIRVPPNVTYWPLLHAAGEQAAAGRRGLWSCPR